MDFSGAVDLGSVAVPVDGVHFASVKAQRIAEILQDYDPNLSLEWIPEGAEPGMDRFRVVCTPPNAPAYVVCSSNEADEVLLAKVFDSDNAKGNVLSRLNSHNAAMEALRLKAQMDEAEEAQDFASWAIRQTRRVMHNGYRFE